jgi:hypothetical protein
MKRIVFLAVAFLLPLIVQSQVKKALFSREDTLLGWNGPERACYDVHHYHLTVEVNPDKRTISGSNEMHFTVLKKTGSIQIDLAPGMGLQRVEWKNHTSQTKRTGFVFEFSRFFDAGFNPFYSHSFYRPSCSSQKPALGRRGGLDQRCRWISLGRLCRANRRSFGVVAVQRSMVGQARQHEN